MCHRRLQQRRPEEILSDAGKTLDTLFCDQTVPTKSTLQFNAQTRVIRADDDYPYLGIRIEEWEAANMRLMNSLLSNGELKRDQIEFYFTFTTKIFEFADIYEWNSVLNFDYSYRELQA